jgi:outer membrane protein assembly factor BamB
MRRIMKLIVCLLGLAAAGADWPGFRGPHGNGVSDERGFPTQWTSKHNIVWKTRLPGPGSSSPIVWKDRVFLTCYTGYGLAKKEGGDVKNLRRHLLCLERKSGTILWNKQVDVKLPENSFTGFITEHGYASSTPVTDGERLYVFFGQPGVLAFDFEGKQLWQTPVGTSLNSWGSGSSPILHDDLLIVNAGVESDALVALDRKSGKEAWRYKGIGDSWSSPLLVEAPGGKREVVLNIQGSLVGIDPDKGIKLWDCEGISTSASTSSPVSDKGMVYAMGSGFEGRTIMAVRAGGRGDVTQTHVLWKQKAGAGVTSPVLAGDHLYWVSGQLGCVKVATGELLFQQRLYEARMEYASPVSADGKIFAFTRRNGAYVFTARAQFEQIAHNDLGDTSDFNSSPALSAGQIFVRSNEYAYCIGEKK